MSRKLPPVGWKSKGALDAERRGLVDTATLALKLKVPIRFLQESAPKHEWHHVRKSTYVGRRYYYEPRHTTDWFYSRRGQRVWESWKKQAEEKRSIPDMVELSMLERIKKASNDGLVMCFTGTGSAFTETNSHTSAIIAKNGVTLLVDCGTKTPQALADQGIKLTDFSAYYFTHAHSDHVGGVEELFHKSRYVTKRKPVILITEDFQNDLWEGTLKGGCGQTSAGPLRFSDYAVTARPVRIEDQKEIYRADFIGFDLIIFRTKHIWNTAGEKQFWSTGLLIDGSVLYSGDTVYDPVMVDYLKKFTKSGDFDHIFHDCQLTGPGYVHATFEELSRMPEDMRSKTYLMHYGDDWLTHKPQPNSVGFKGWARPWEIYAL